MLPQIFIWKWVFIFFCPSRDRNRLIPIPMMFGFWLLHLRPKRNRCLHSLRETSKHEIHMRVFLSTFYDISDRLNICQAANVRPRYWKPIFSSRFLVLASFHFFGLLHLALVPFAVCISIYVAAVCSVRSDKYELMTCISTYSLYTIFQ